MHRTLVPAVGVLSLVAKYAARSVSQPSIHVYPELYVKNLHKTYKFFWIYSSLYLTDIHAFINDTTTYHEIGEQKSECECTLKHHLRWV